MMVLTAVWHLPVTIHCAYNAISTYQHVQVTWASEFHVSVNFLLLLVKSENVNSICNLLIITFQFCWLQLHLGVNGGAKKFAIERQAFNEATFCCPDELGWQPLVDSLLFICPLLLSSYCLLFCSDSNIFIIGLFFIPETTNSPWWWGNK